MDRYTEEMKLWLFDVAHENLDDKEILKGFINHYVLQGLVIHNIADDIVFHTFYGEDGVRTAIDSDTKVLNEIVR